MKYFISYFFFLAHFVAESLGGYTDGQVFFTETVSGSCNSAYSYQYVYDYEQLGGQALDTVTQLGIGFWLRFR